MVSPKEDGSNRNVWKGIQEEMCLRSQITESHWAPDASGRDRRDTGRMPHTPSSLQVLCLRVYKSRRCSAEDVSKLPCTGPGWTSPFSGPLFKEAPCSQRPTLPPAALTVTLSSESPFPHPSAASVPVTPVTHLEQEWTSPAPHCLGSHWPLCCRP